MKKLLVIISMLVLSACQKEDTCYTYFHYAVKDGEQKMEEATFDHKLDSNEIENFLEWNKSRMFVNPDRRWLQYFDSYKCDNPFN